MNLDRAEIERHYAQLPDFPGFPGEREWPDRLHTVDEFIETGPVVADHMRELRDSYGPGAVSELERRKAMFPQLWELLFKAYPPDPLR